jgi:hypothetical protein
VIWIWRNVTDERGKKAFYLSNMVTDGANPNQPIGEPNTYMMHADQRKPGAYNLQVLVGMNHNIIVNMSNGGLASFRS